MLAARIAAKKTGREVRPYKCIFCSGYHCGNKPLGNKIKRQDIAVMDKSFSGDGMVDVGDLKSPGLGRDGSNPSPRTIQLLEVK